MQIEKALRKPYFTFELGPFNVPLKTPFLYRRLTFGANSRYVALSGRQEEEQAFVWDLQTQKLLRPKLFGTSFLNFIGPQASTGKVLLMGGLGHIWDIEKNQEFTRLQPAPEECPDGVVRRPYFDFCTEIDLTGRYVLGASLYDAVYMYSQLGLWEIPVGRKVRRFTTPPVKYNNARVRFSPDGKWFIFGGKPDPDSTGLDISIWETETGNLLFRDPAFPKNLGMNDFNYEISPDCKVLAVADTFYIIDRERGLEEYKPAGLESSNQSTPDYLSKKLLPNRELLSQTQAGEMGIYDLDGNQKLGLSLEYQVKVKGKPVVKQLMPRAFGSSSQYYAAADDEVLLIWQRNG
jgi:WD40 repeat protein